MTALDRNRIPASIITVEQLHVWSGMILKHNNPNQRFQEVESKLTIAITEDDYHVDFDNNINPTSYLEVIRATLPLDNNWRLKNKKWEAILEVSQEPIPIELMS